MHKPPAVADNPSPPEAAVASVIAAVDLGSNSFHMIVGELRHGQLAILDRIRETVRLAEGLGDDGELAADARERALECLARFGERLRDMHADNVRAAGTSTIRRASADADFHAAAEAALGHPIEVISGIEEARLVYNGVTHSMPPTDGMRLVVDIGGGSTEVILGQGPTPRAMESLHLGCVSMTERFFPDGGITAERFARARTAARLELRPVKAFFRKAEALEAIGASGTLRATELVAQSLGLTAEGLTAAAVEALIARVIEIGRIDALSLQGLSERRAQVWPGGLAIVAELFDALRVSRFSISDGALREGLLYDQLGRLQHEDARERTVSAMSSRYHVDEEQAARVAAMADSLYRQCKASWGFSSRIAGNVLDWAARLHEIGLDISHDGYQRHGAYIVANADMPGFPRAEQQFLSAIIGGQRHRIEQRPIKSLPATWRVAALRFVMILRLAVLLNRGRSAAAAPEVQLDVGDDWLELGFDADWLAANPLTVADLEREAVFVAEAGYSLRFG